MPTRIAAPPLNRFISRGFEPSAQIAHFFDRVPADRRRKGVQLVPTARRDDADGTPHSIRQFAAAMMAAA